MPAFAGMTEFWTFYKFIRFKILLSPQYIFPEKISHGSSKGHNQEPAKKRTGKILGKTKDKRKKDGPQIGQKVYETKRGCKGSRIRCAGDQFKYRPEIKGCKPDGSQCQCQGDQRRINSTQLIPGNRLPQAMRPTPRAMLILILKRLASMPAGVCINAWVQSKALIKTEAPV